MLTSCSVSETGKTESVKDTDPMQNTSAEDKSRAPETEEKTSEPGSSQPETEKEAEDEILIVINNQLSEIVGDIDGWLGRELKEKFGINVRLINTDMTSSDEKADICVCFSITGEPETDGTVNILDWNKDGLLDKYGEIIKNLPGDVVIKGENGEVTGIWLDNMADDTITDIPYTWSVSWERYKALGNPSVADLDEFKKILIDMTNVNKEDDIYAMELIDGFIDGLQIDAYNLAKSYYGLSYDNGIFTEIKTGESESVFEDGGSYYNALKFLNGLYSSGAIRKEYLSATECDKKTEDGKVVFAPYSLDVMSEMQTADYLPVVPEEAVTVGYKESRSKNTYVVINADTENAEKCISLLNWLASEEGILTCMYGPEGTGWYKDAEGALVMTETGHKIVHGALEENAGNTYLYMPIYRSNSNIPGTAYNYDYTTWEKNEYPVSDNVTEWLDMNQSSSVYDYFVKQKGTPLDENTSNNTVFESTSQNEAKYTKTWNCIFAENDDEFEKCWKELKGEK